VLEFIREWFLIQEYVGVAKFMVKAIFILPYTPNGPFYIRVPSKNNKGCICASVDSKGLIDGYMWREFVWEGIGI